MKSDEESSTPPQRSDRELDLVVNRMLDNLQQAHVAVTASTGYDPEKYSSTYSEAASLIRRLRGLVVSSERAAWVESAKQLPPFGQRVLGCWIGDKSEIDVAIYAGEWQDPENEDDSYAQPKFWMPLPGAPK